MCCFRCNWVIQLRLNNIKFTIFTELIIIIEASFLIICFLKGGQYATMVRDDMYSGKAHIVYLDESSQMPDDVVNALGAPPKTFKESESEDATFVRQHISNTKLYQ